VNERVCCVAPSCTVPEHVGTGVGAGVGDGVGDAVGDAVGAGVGDAVGDGVGAGVGDGVGEGVGAGVGGAGVGNGVGAGVGNGVGDCVVHTHTPSPPHQALAREQRFSFLQSPSAMRLCTSARCSVVHALASRRPVSGAAEEMLAVSTISARGRNGHIVGGCVLVLCGGELRGPILAILALCSFPVPEASKRLSEGVRRRNNNG